MDFANQNNIDRSRDTYAYKWSIYKFSIISQVRREFKELTAIKITKWLKKCARYWIFHLVKQLIWSEAILWLVTENKTMKQIFSNL